MSVESLDAIIYTAFFFMPGFFISDIVEAFVPEKRRSTSGQYLSFLGYSIINLGFWFWGFIYIYNQYQDNSTKYWVLLLFFILLSSFLTGIVIGLVKRFDPLRKLLLKMGINIANSIPTAWEYKFSSLDEGSFLTVYLDDGTIIRGAFFNKSMASSDAEELDLYLEEAYMLDDNDIWMPVEESDGVWISSKSIKWISFISNVGG